MTLLFMYVYTKIFETSKLGFIYIIVYLFHAFFAVFSILISGENILEFLYLLPILLGMGIIVRLCILNYKKENSIKWRYETQIHKINLLNIIITITIPLIIINTIGRIYFIFAN